MGRVILDMPPVPDDADAKTFRTYKSYMDAWLWVMKELYKPDLSGIKTYLESQPPFGKLYRANVDANEVRRHLRSAWATETAMAAVLETGANDAVRYGNIWVPVQAYYAVYASCRAYLVASGTTTDSHAGVMRALGHKVQNSLWHGSPWTATCTGCPQQNSQVLGGVPALANIGISNLSIPRNTSDAWGLIALCLKKTRERAVDDLLTDWKKEKRRKAAKAQEKEDLANRLGPTTLLDFLYRMRIRSNYRDTDAFALGAWWDEEAEAFYRTCLDLTSATLRWLELLVRARTGGDIFDQILREYLNSSRPVRDYHPAARYWKTTGHPVEAPTPN